MFKPKRQTFITKKSWDYYERHCRGKIKHRAIHSANSHIEGLQKKEPNAVFTFYVCNFCTFIHVGHLKNAPGNIEQKGQHGNHGK